MIFVYEIPMVLVLVVVLGILGLFGEAIIALPMKAAVVDAIIEVVLLGFVVKRHIDDKQRPANKSQPLKLKKQKKFSERKKDTTKRLPEQPKKFLAGRQP